MATIVLALGTYLAVGAGITAPGWGATTHGRPRLGLALSGGGAKGLAHIGAIGVFEEAGLSAEIVTGTSMGAVVGALYALGYSPAAMESITVAVDWGDIFDDVPDRSVLAMETKQFDSRFVLALPVANWRPTLPSGLIYGQKIQWFYTDLYWPAHDARDFTTLPRSFACVTTDLSNGKAVRLQSGYLPEAVRASMSIPSVFLPITIDGRVLVDGFVRRNLPVEDARALGADVVIAVDVGAPLKDAHQFKNLVDVMNQTVAFAGYEENQRQLALSDLVVTPHFDGITGTDYNRAYEIIRLGEEAARAVLPGLRTLADSLATLGSVPEVRQLTAPDTLSISEIEVEGLVHASETQLLSYLGLSIPGAITRRQIDDGIREVYGSLNFELVTYRLRQTSTGTILQIRVKERQPDYLRFGFRYDTIDKAAILLNLNLMNRLIQGSQTTIEARLGDIQVFRLEYFTYTGMGLRLGARLFGHLRLENMVAWADPESLLDVRRRQGAVDLMLGTLYSSWFLAGAGIAQVWDKYMPTVTEQSEFDNFKDSHFDTRLFMRFDTLPRLDFADRGLLIDLLYQRSWRNSGWEPFTVSETRGEIYAPVSSRWSLGCEWLIGHAEGDGLPPAPWYYLAKGREFLGFTRGELFGYAIHSTRVHVQWEPSPRRFLQVAGQLGNTFDSWPNPITLDMCEWGWGLTGGMLTRAGPLELTIHDGPDRPTRFFFRFGYNF